MSDRAICLTDDAFDAVEPEPIPEPPAPPPAQVAPPVQAGVAVGGGGSTVTMGGWNPAEAMTQAEFEQALQEMQAAAKQRSAADRYQLELQRAQYLEYMNELREQQYQQELRRRAMEHRVPRTYTSSASFAEEPEYPEHYYQQNRSRFVEPKPKPAAAPGGELQINRIDPHKFSDWLKGF